MDYWSLEITALALLPLLLGGAIFVFVIARQLNQIGRRIDRLQNTALPPITSSLAGLKEAEPFVVSPLTRLTFQQSLDPAQFAEANRQSAEASIVAFVARRAADGVLITVGAVRLTQQGAEMVVSASADGRRLLKAGEAIINVSRSGERLPQLVNPTTRKIIENLKETPFSSVVSRLASLSSIVIAAAHLVAGADLAKRLARVESKLDILIAARRIDQLAKLERIYCSARELAYRKIDAHRMFEMWRLRGELRELRSVWRQEFNSKLEKIEDPANDTWFSQLFLRQWSDQRVKSGISAAEAEIALIDYSMRLDHVLAVGSDTIEEFQDSQESELEQLDQVCDLLQRKAGYISGRHPKLSVQPVVETLSGLVTAYRDALPRTIPAVPELRSLPS